MFPPSRIVCLTEETVETLCNEGLTRVALAYAEKPILSAEQVEDVVAFLATVME